ncbi:MAG: cobalamin-binding protein, partial [Candidatus Tectomicrobia bacterium]|nr:cobalamin-binding protein [Candidatus Tectomicrobia bacterium]
IVSLQPDLVLAAGELQRATIEALERVGITVVALEDPNNFDEVYMAITLTGQMTGHLAEARQVVQAMQARMDRVLRKVATIPPASRVAVFYEVYDQPLMTAGQATIIGQMLEMAGGINVFADLQGRYPQVSAEEVVKRNPTCILGLKGHKTSLTPTQIRQRPGWDRILAVQRNCIHLLDDDTVARPGPRLAEALEAIAKSLHPDLFSME